MLPIDTYVSIAPETNFVSKGYLSLGTAEVFIYVSTTNELRASVYGETTYSVLDTGVVWVSCVQDGAMGHIYYVDLLGGIHHLEYDQPGPPIHAPKLIGNLPVAITVSALYQPNSTPPVWVMMLDDGLRHHLFTAASTDPGFTAILNSGIAYNNAMDANFYSTQPSIAVHPSDTKRCTVSIQQVSLSNQQVNVGFYVAVIPGVS